MRWKAVIFDMDGTLLETERLVVDAGMTVLAQQGYTPRRDVLEGLIGTVSAESALHFRAAYGQDFDFAAYEQAWDRTFLASLAQGIPLRPGVEELFALLDRLNLPRALATNSRTQPAHDHLGGAGILHHFAPAHIHGRDQVANPKPAPDLFLLAAKGLGVDPADCLVFEDSDPGAQGAVAAGMAVVQIPDQRAPEFTGATYLATSLMEGARLAGLLED